MKKLAIIALIFMSLFANAQHSKDLFKQGVEEYQLEQYAAAVNTFQQLYDLDYRNFEVCFNLGNAYYKTNDYASAILYYERARLLEPSNQDVIYNLEIANNHLVDKIDAVPDLFYEKWWQNTKALFSPKTWCGIGITLFIVLVASISIFYITTNFKVRKSTFATIIVSALLYIFTFVVCWSIKSETNNRSEAIVFVPTVTAKGSPAVNSVDLFVLHKGTKVTLTDRVGDWVEIRLANGKIGWMPVADVQII